MLVILRVEWRPALELSQRGVGSNSQGSIAGPSTDSSPSSADDPASSLQQVSSGGGSGHNRPGSAAVPNANSNNTGGVPNSGRNSQRRRSTRHQNYLNRSQLHEAVDLPDGYGVHHFLLLVTCIIITHAACIAADVGRAFSRICLSVCLHSKRKTACAIITKLGTHILYSSRLACIDPEGKRSRSHGYENCHGRTVASESCCYGLVLLLPVWVCMSIGLPIFF